MEQMTGRIAFQGEPGAYSHQACRQSRPDMEAVPCPTFEEVIDLTRRGEVDLGMLAVEKLDLRTVADVHTLLPQSGLHIIDEAFVRVHINLLAVKGTRIEDVKRVRCMSILHGQCRTFIKQHGLATMNWHDNAAAAREVARFGRTGRSCACLGVGRRDLRARHPRPPHRRPVEQHDPLPRHGARTRPVASWQRTDDHTLHLPCPQHTGRALQGAWRFCDQRRQHDQAGKLHVGGSFTATEFYADIEGHPEDAAVARALEELRFFTTQLNILGVYPSDRSRD